MTVVVDKEVRVYSCPTIVTGSKGEKCQHKSGGNRESTSFISPSRVKGTPITIQFLRYVNKRIYTSRVSPAPPDPFDLVLKRQKFFLK